MRGGVPTSEVVVAEEGLFEFFIVHIGERDIEGFHVCILVSVYQNYTSGREQKLAHCAHLPILCLTSCRCEVAPARRRPRDEPARSTRAPDVWVCRRAAAEGSKPFIIYKWRRITLYKSLSSTQSSPKLTTTSSRSSSMATDKR